MSIFLETKRLIIKSSTLEDLDDLCALQSDIDVMKYIGQGVRNPEDMKKWFEKSLSHYQKHGFSFGSVFEKKSGYFIGQAGIVYLDYDDSQPDIEVGYRLSKEYWHHGYATELAKALISWGFEHLSINKLVAVINPNNERSRSVLERVGMHYVGRINCYNMEVAKYEILKNTTTHNEIELVAATLNDYPIIQNMAAYYAYDISEYMGWAQQKDGTHSIGMDFIKYWNEKNTFPFIIKYKNELAGFAIVDKKVTEEKSDYNMAQFFILRNIKGKGVGKHVAFQCFDKFHGQWEIFVMPNNEGAYRFWRSTIKKYTNGNFSECTRMINGFNRNIFLFQSRR